MAATLCLPIFEHFPSLLFWRKYLSAGFLLFLDSNFKPTGFLAVPKLIKGVMKTCFPRNIKLFQWNSPKDIHKTDLFVMLDMLLLSSITISFVKTKWYFLGAGKPHFSASRHIITSPFIPFLTHQLCVNRKEVCLIPDICHFFTQPQFETKDILHSA